jgi:hypothetical protein
MKDALGHGSDVRGAIENYAVHQHGIMSSVPSVEGSNLWAALSANAQQRHPDEHSGFDRSDLRGMYDSIDASSFEKRR